MAYHILTTCFTFLDWDDEVHNFRKKINRGLERNNRIEKAIKEETLINKNDDTVVASKYNLDLETYPFSEIKYNEHESSIFRRQS